MNKSVKAKCVVCDKTFTKNSANQVVCSSKCRRIHKQKNKKISEIKRKAKKMLPAKSVKAICKEPIKIEKQAKHVIKRGDIITFENFNPDQLMKVALKLFCMSILSR